MYLCQIEKPTGHYCLGTMMTRVSSPLLLPLFFKSFPFLFPSSFPFFCPPLGNHRAFLTGRERLADCAHRPTVTAGNNRLNKGGSLCCAGLISFKWLWYCRLLLLQREKSVFVVRVPFCLGFYFRNLL